MCVCVHEVLERVWIVLRVSVCARAYHGVVSVEVVSARRENLLYKRRADVSYVYPRSHSTKEPCIPNHSNPRPSLSWFSDINNFLFHFPPFIPPPPFLLCTSFSAVNRGRFYGKDFDFWWFCVRERQCWWKMPWRTTTGGDLRLLRWCFPQQAEAPSCASRDKTTGWGTVGTAPLWEMT